MNFNDVPRLGIVGGPCAGKSTGLPFLQENLGDRGFYAHVVPEAPTILMQGGAKPQVYDEKVFQRGVIETMHNLETSFARIAATKPELRPVLLCDRGIPDAEPYMRKGLYEEILSELGLGTKVEARDGRYKGAFHLRTAAFGAEYAYSTANNATRRESLEEARERDEATLWAWTGHPHLRVIDNSTDFAGKMHRLEKEVYALLGIPVPIEIEKKYRCTPVRLEDIPRDTIPVQQIEIEQLYLHRPRGEDCEIRVRKRGQYGSYVYFRTEKRTVRPGERIETEKFITAKEYEWSSQFAEKAMHKERWCFVYENQYFELDIIPEDGSPTYLLEIELTDLQQSVKLPRFINTLEDVTGDPKFSNYHMARAA